MEKLGAQECHASIYEKQSKSLDDSKGKGSLRTSFMKFFTTSRMGLGVDTTGALILNPSRWITSNRHMSFGRG
jgi:hypothetical protein